MFGKSVHAPAVQNWFEQEASIRDPTSSVFTIRPLVREKCLQYFGVKSPIKHKKMSEEGKTNQ